MQCGILLVQDCCVMMRIRRPTHVRTPSSIQAKGERERECAPPRHFLYKTSFVSKAKKRVRTIRPNKIVFYFQLNALISLKSTSTLKSYKTQFLSKPEMNKATKLTLQFNELFCRHLFPCSEVVFIGGSSYQTLTEIPELYMYRL